VGTIVDDPYLGNEGEPSRGFDLLDEPDSDGCQQKVRDEQRAVLENLGALVSNPDASVCFRDIDPEYLLWVAQTFEWSVWNRWPAWGDPLYCDELFGEDASLEDLERSFIRAMAAATPLYDWLPARYQDLREWNVETQIRSEFVPLVEQARKDLGLAPVFEGPWGSSVEYDPTVVDQARERIRTEAPSLIAFYHGDSPVRAWELDLADAPDSLSVLFPKYRAWPSDVDTLDEPTRDALRQLLTSWVGEQGIVPEEFDGRESGLVIP
jgi:hypothetical protein